MRHWLAPLYRLLTLARAYWLPFSLIPAVLTPLLLPLPLLASQRFHHDEALYATWALRISSGQDPWLAQTPVDKPPLFLYILAGVMHGLGNSETAARIPSLVASALMVLFTFGIGRQLYSNGTGVLAAWLVALSPFTLLFAPTAFTDPLLVALVLAAGLAAAHQQAGLAGICSGLAIATKQQGLFFIPLPLLLLLLTPSQENNPAPSLNSALQLSPPYKPPYALRFTNYVLPLLLTLLPAFLWDYSRNQPSGFLEQSLANYGGLGAATANFGERWSGFLELLWYSTASPILNLTFLIGCPPLLAYGVWRRWQGVYVFDWLFFLFSLLFLLLHAFFSFQVWDRYLLGLIPLLGLLLARTLLFPWSLFSRPLSRYLPAPLLKGIICLGLILFLGFNLAHPVQDAINGRYPLGSNSQAISGIDQIVAYLRGHVGANHTLYHRWLGAHWRFYLWGYPYDLQYWATPTGLAAKAQPGHLIAFPTWQSDTEARLALFERGLLLHELTRAYSSGGAPSIVLYEIRARN